ncbi:hypothetical protein KM043_009094 [Ampulex compressa]|nr:hypothetical protein KM043_009094 [Ampulex compressa]
MVLASSRKLQRSFNSRNYVFSKGVERKLSFATNTFVQSTLAPGSTKKPRIRRKFRKARNETMEHGLAIEVPRKDPRRSIGSVWATVTCPRKGNGDLERWFLVRGTGEGPSLARSEAARGETGSETV